MAQQDTLAAPPRRAPPIAWVTLVVPPLIHWSPLEQSRRARSAVPARPARSAPCAASATLSGGDDDSGDDTNEPPGDSGGQQPGESLEGFILRLLDTVLSQKEGELADKAGSEDKSQGDGPGDSDEDGDNSGTDGDNRETTGDIEYDDVEVVFPMVKGQAGNMEDVKIIINSWADGTGAPWNSTLTILDKEGEEVRTIKFHEAFPTKASPPPVINVSDILDEAMTIKAK